MSSLCLCHGRAFMVRGRLSSVCLCHGRAVIERGRLSSVCLCHGLESLVSFFLVTRSSMYYFVTRSSMLYIIVVSQNHISTTPSLLSSSLWKQYHHRKLYNTNNLIISHIFTISLLFILNTNLTQTLQHPSLLYSPSLFLFTK